VDCPRCRSPLLPFFLEDGDAPVEGAQCAACRGAFFSSMNVAIAATKSAGSFTRRGVPDRAAQAVDLECPACAPAVVMGKRAANVTVDVCPQCGGAWLDGGEVRSLRA
jgi:uncharacterized protein